MSLGKYSSIIVAFAAVSLTAILPALEGKDAGLAVTVGAVVAASNAIAAYALVLWGVQRSNVAFFRAVLGGTLGRMVFLLAALVAGITVFGFPRLPLVASLVGYFSVFLALELTVVHRRSGNRVETAR